MRIIPPAVYERRDRNALLDFLHGCRRAAEEDGHEKLASVSLAVEYADPLAVLDAIYEPGHLHFYLERPASGEAVAGAEAVVSADFFGRDRFAQAKDFVCEVVTHSIATGDVAGGFTGPHFFCGFTFGDEPSAEGFFPPARVFVPRWQVANANGRYTAVANMLVTATTDVEPLAKRTLMAHRRFSSFCYDEVDRNRAPKRPAVAQVQEVGACGDFQRSVKVALENIAAGRYDKIVLARAVELISDTALNPLNALNKLRNAYPDCFAFSIANGRDQSFVGATPERLVKMERGFLRTEALAGTTGRGNTARDDAQFARELLESQKERHEHQFVVDSIMRSLRSLSLDPRAELPPKILKLPNVQHLQTPIDARIDRTSAAPIHLLDVVKALFPTPAVGGTPRAHAVPEIQRIEPFDRGLYAGALGWLNYLGDGEMVVGIRSALIDDRKARLYAGSGIVAESDPELEKIETDMKLRALLDVLTGH